MGCTESIISAVVAKSNETPKVSKNQAKVQPAPLKGDRKDRDEARERRRKAVLERHAKAQSMAQTISAYENAMAEKERLSSSTWRSWKSAGNSDVLSPAVSISVRGSEGTASPDVLPNPSSAYNQPKEQSNISSPHDAGKDIYANEMQIRTMELPNQVTDEANEAANQNAQHSKLMNNNERPVDDGEMNDAKQKEQRDSVAAKTLQENNNGDQIQEPVEEAGDQPHLASQVRGEPKDTKSEDKLLNQDLEDNKSKGEETSIETKKHKKKGKHKEVTFSIQEFEHADRVTEGRKSTSQGR